MANRYVEKLKNEGIQGLGEDLQGIIAGETEEERNEFIEFSEYVTNEYCESSENQKYLSALIPFFVELFNSVNSVLYDDGQLTLSECNYKLIMKCKERNIKIDSKESIIRASFYDTVSRGCSQEEISLGVVEFILDSKSILSDYDYAAALSQAHGEYLQNGVNSDFEPRDLKWKELYAEISKRLFLYAKLFVQNPESFDDTEDTRNFLYSVMCESLFADFETDLSSDEMNAIFKKYFDLSDSVGKYEVQYSFAKYVFGTYKIDVLDDESGWSDIEYAADNEVDIAKNRLADKSKTKKVVNKKAVKKEKTKRAVFASVAFIVSLGGILMWVFGGSAITAIVGAVVAFVGGGVLASAAISCHKALGILNGNCKNEKYENKSLERTKNGWFSIILNTVFSNGLGVEAFLWVLMTIAGLGVLPVIWSYIIAPKD